MASRPPHYNRYQIETQFVGDTFIHLAYTTDLPAGQRRVAVYTTWDRQRLLGRGAFGEVWLERGEETGELRAVKVIRKRDVNIRELEALIDLRDRPDLFIVFRGWFENSYNVYIAMEYIAYGNLGEYMDLDGDLAKKNAREIASQILEGLVVLHEREICHRDLKPQNILIASLSPMWVKISDFGLSKNWSQSPLLSQCGTRPYQAPELRGLLPSGRLIDRQPYTKNVDLWALGAVIHEVLTAEIPFVVKTMPAMDSSEADTRSNSAQWDLRTEDLYQYCQDFQFPTAALLQHNASSEEIELITSLMAPNPIDRVSAVEALQNGWFTRIVDSEPGLLGQFEQSMTITESPTGRNPPSTSRPGTDITIRNVYGLGNPRSHRFETPGPDEAMSEGSDQPAAEVPNQAITEAPAQVITEDPDQAEPDVTALPDQSSGSNAWTSWFRRSRVGSQLLRGFLEPEAES